MASNQDIESLMNKQDYQGILDILKDEKLQNKMLFQVETSITQIIDLVETDFIIKNLTGQNDKIKQAILYSLLEGNRNIENEEALIPVFLDFLNDKNELLVAYSASLLGAFNEEDVIDSLIKLLNHRYFDARSCAAISLERIGDTRAIKPLITRIHKERQDEVKDCIIEALKSFNNDYANAEIEKYIDSITPLHLREVTKTFRLYDKSKPVELYTKSFKDENEEVRKYASFKFVNDICDERTKDDLINSIINDSSHIVKYNCALALARILAKNHETEIENFLIECFDSEDEEIVKSGIIGFRSCLTEKSTNALIDLLFGEKNYCHNNVLYTLYENGYFYDVSNFDMFVKMLYEGKSGGYAIIGISLVKNKKAIAPLIFALNNDSIGNRELASEALGEIGEVAIEPLIEVLEDKNTFKKKKLLRATAKALCNIKSPKTTDALIKMTSIKDVYVRVDACIALGKRKNSKSIAALKECSFDEHVKVQDTAEKSLRKLGVK
ncbi:HEAT repeat domain-containing protein [Methanolobus halotolerans]|uniref:HEAT repeat n=1 Tax=Methanolobus halotolerans TaxID=2052935 RepID=A0A4E0Q5K6_9EURY|nr:HEAT repeat domain-containing protein [Methanolobus halotolerans]TGC09460.1 hypothetical protein CUN85_06420 [Methanolobus halotolerans]